jgi:5'-nucleotidase
VAWNDMHGQIMPDDPVVDTGNVPAGGVAAVADQVAAVRASGDYVVVLDAGDQFTGPMASTLAEGEPVVLAYKIIGVDAAAIGNHDFDFGPVGYARVTAPAGVGDEAGPDGPRGALLARMAQASYPFLSANVHMKDGKSPAWPGHRPSASVERGGFKVGVVGYTTRETPATTLAPNVRDLDFTTGAAAAVAREIRALRAAGNAPVVLLSHASLEGELPQALGDRGARTGELAELVQELGADLPDLIIAGHRHAWMVGRVGGVPIVSSDQHGVGVARIRFCREGSPAPRLSSIERRVAMATAPPASELGARVEAAMAPWVARVKAESEALVATLPRACAAKAQNGAAFGEQIARATAERVADAAAPPRGVPVVGLTNSGSVRAPLPAGPLRFADVFAALPFENTVATCATTRGGLVRFVENAIRKDSARERFPFGISGARVRVKRGPDGRLTLLGVVIEGEPKGSRDDAPVWLAISDFILFGGDGLLDGVTCAPRATSQTRIRDAWRGAVAREQGGCDGPARNVIVE